MDDWADDLDGWMRRLRAGNRSPKTLRIYEWNLLKFASWCARHDRPVNFAEYTVVDIEEHLVWLYAQGYAETTVLLRFACLKQWFRFLEDRSRIRESPMTRMRPPKITVRPVQVLTDDEVRRMLAACADNGCSGVRDSALIRFFYDTGCRSREVTGLTMGNVRLTALTARVLGKGSVVRDVPIGVLTAQAMEDWLDVRSRLDGADLPNVWLGRHSRPLRQPSVYHALRKVGERAGIPGVYPHRFRHTFAHQWLDSGGQAIDLMNIAGLRSLKMLTRYGQSVAAERAIKAHRTYSPGDRL